MCRQNNVKVLLVILLIRCLTMRFYTTKLCNLTSSESRDTVAGVMGRGHESGDREGFVSYFNKRLQGNRWISDLDGFFFVNEDQGRNSKVIDLRIVSFLLNFRHLCGPFRTVFGNKRRPGCVKRGLVRYKKFD